MSKDEIFSYLNSKKTELINLINQMVIQSRNQREVLATESEEKILQYSLSKHKNFLKLKEIIKQLEDKIQEILKSNILDKERVEAFVSSLNQEMQVLLDGIFLLESENLSFISKIKSDIEKEISLISDTRSNLSKIQKKYFSDNSKTGLFDREV